MEHCVTKPKLRSVQTTVWSLSKKFKRLDPLQKLLFLFLITNERTTLCGVYEIDLDEIALRTGIDDRTLPEMFEAMEQIGIAAYRDGWVLIPNYKANYDNDSVRTAVKKCLDAIPPDVKSTYDRLSTDCDQCVDSRVPTRTRTRIETRTSKNKNSSAVAPLKDDLAAKVERSFIKREPMSSWPSIPRGRKDCNEIAKKLRALSEDTGVTPEELAAALFASFIRLRDTSKSSYWRNAGLNPTDFLTRWSGLVSEVRKQAERAQDDQEGIEAWKRVTGRAG